MKIPLKNIPAIAVVFTDKDVYTAKKEEILEADLIELRVDLFEDIENIEDTFKLAKVKFNLPILATIRILSEGGKREFSEREDFFRKVLPYSDFVDLEIFSKDVTSIKRAIREYGKIMIASYHRFDLTPSLEELEAIFTEGKTLESDIIKIATMVNDPLDLEVLLLFTLKHRKDNIIVIGMGEKGIPSRIINPIFGSLITYASFIDSSAPGQIPLRELIKIFKVLKIR
jgi:3-dehydroquinate dehydratase type I